MPADLIIYAVIAVALVIWLKNTLGTQSEGDEPIKTVRAPLPDIEEVKASIVASELSVEQKPQDQIDALSDDKTGIIAVDGDAAQKGLVALLEADPTMDLKFFFNAAQDVFVMGVESFADGDTETLDGILGDDVYSAFEAAIHDRTDQRIRHQCEVVAIEQAHIIDSELKGKKAFVTIRFVAEQTHAVYDGNDQLLEGHPEKTHAMTDIWVFSRDLKSKDPRWLVVETRGDFEGDNDIIPNA